MKKIPNITARDFPTILGCNPYQTTYNLLEDKIEKKYPFYGNKFTDHGNKYESQAIKAFEEKIGLPINEQQTNICHSDYEWITGRLDGIIYSKKRKKTPEMYVVEIKCPLKTDRTDELTEENIPIHYWCQCQVYMNLIDSDFAYYVEYYIRPDDDVKNAKLYYVKIKKDENWWANSLPIINKFYDEMVYYSKIGNLDSHPVRMVENKWKLNLVAATTFS